MAVSYTGVSRNYYDKDKQTIWFGNKGVKFVGGIPTVVDGWGNPTGEKVNALGDGNFTITAHGGPYHGTTVKFNAKGQAWDQHGNDISDTNQGYTSGDDIDQSDIDRETEREEEKKAFNPYDPTGSLMDTRTGKKFQEDVGFNIIPPSAFDKDGNLLPGLGEQERDAGVWSEARRIQQQDLNRKAGKSMSDANRLASNQMENVAMRGGLRTGARGRIAQTGLRAGLAAQQQTLGKRLGLDVKDEEQRQGVLKRNIDRRTAEFDKGRNLWQDYTNKMIQKHTGEKASERV